MLAHETILLQLASTGRNRPAESELLPPRERRVSWLLFAIVLLSLFDLLVTVNYMTSTGLFEANPVVHWVLAIHPSASGVTLFKILTVLAGVAILYALRRSLLAEFGAWLVVGVLLHLAFQWGQYVDLMAELPLAMLADAGPLETTWVHLN